MSKAKLKPCPFCGAKLKDEYPTVDHYDRGKWQVSHNCKTGRRYELVVCITAYGSTKEQAVERWNGRADNAG